MNEIILLGNPQSTNHIYRRGGHVIYMSEDGRTMKKSYIVQAKQQFKNPPFEGNLSVSIQLYFKDKRRRDIDNWHKILLDSLTGIVWNDDSQIQEMRVRKNIDPANPRIVINISKLQEC